MDVKSIRQTEAADCGLACLAIVSGILGAHFELAELRRKHPVSTRGLTLDEIMRIGASLEMSARPLRCEVEELRDLQTPAILHWGLNHFVVLRKVGSRAIQIQDPARGMRKVSMKEVSARFTGVAVEMGRSPGFKRRRGKGAGRPPP